MAGRGRPKRFANTATARQDAMYLKSAVESLQSAIRNFEMCPNDISNEQAIDAYKAVRKLANKVLKVSTSIKEVR